MLGRMVAEALARTPPEELWSQGVRDVCAECDLVVVNLECCLSERGEPTELIPAKPYFFRGPPDAVDALRALATSVAGLANNHALDFGLDAFADTLEHVRGAGIATAGAGLDAAEARRGVVVEAAGLRLGVLAVSDHPREYAAEEGRPGIAWADLRRGLPDWVTAELRRLRSEAELVLAFPHWGPNMTSRPATWQRERARELLAAGADAIAGHSAHVFHGAAITPAGPLLYDLGDALDDYAVDTQLRNDLGLLALWRPGTEPEVELVGLRLDYCRTELAAGADADWIATRVAHACGELGTDVTRRDENRFALSPGGRF
jgi:poly-gamma-glutamate capsule biosynthesis protein CapA/YwtB (metallophosphatase superfamily)